jgi:hypothetical protein
LLNEFETTLQEAVLDLLEVGLVLLALEWLVEESKSGVVEDLVEADVAVAEKEKISKLVIRRI